MNSLPYFFLVPIKNVAAKMSGLKMPLKNNFAVENVSLVM